MDGKLKILTERRSDGYYVVIEPSLALFERGWTTLEKGPYETEEIANENARTIAKAMQSVFPPPI